MSTIETERLILRCFTEDDAEAMFRNWTCEEKVFRYCSSTPHKNIDETRTLLSRWIKEYEKGIVLRWGITLRNGADEVIGTIGVVETSDNGKIAAVGYALGSSYWGRGLMTEALGAVIKQLLGCGFKKVVACHHVDNSASGRVMKKCGMKFTHHSIFHDGFNPKISFRVRCYSIKRKKFRDFLVQLIEKKKMHDKP